MLGGDDAKSWGELLQAHVRRRTQLEWSKEAQEPVKFVTRHEMSRKEREFDPVLQRFRSDSRESTLQREEVHNRTAKLNQQKVKQLGKGQHHDVITHNPVLPTIPPLEAGLQHGGAADRRVAPGYNIISNLDLADHHPSAPSVRPQRVERSFATKAVARQSSRPDFDIISNRYKDNHEAKVSIDRTIEKQAAADKYWQTRDFDPITCKFVDSSKEERFQQKRSELEKTHGHDFAKGLPPCVRSSQSLQIDIVSMQPKSTGAVQSTTTAVSSSAARQNPNSRQVVERIQQERIVGRARLEEARNSNRHSEDRQRHVHGYDHGYDIVSTTAFFGRSGIAKPPLRVPERKSLWQKLEQQQLDRKAGSNNIPREQDLSQREAEHR